MTFILVFVHLLQTTTLAMPFKKGKSGNPHGRKQGVVNKKRADWEAMGETLTGTWTEYVTKYGTDLIENDNFEEFYPLYKDMVNYFKPRMQSSQVEAKAEISITINEPDWND